MKDIRKPPFWHRIGWSEKAAYLCSSRQAKDYSEACAMLKKRKPVKRPEPAPVVMRYPYAND